MLSLGVRISYDTSLGQGLPRYFGATPRPGQFHLRPQLLVCVGRVLARQRNFFSNSGSVYRHAGQLMRPVRGSCGNQNTYIDTVPVAQSNSDYPDALASGQRVCNHNGT
jgi:hypothetical protein